MSESIQKCCVDQVRRQFLGDAAALYGRPLAADLDETDDYDDAGALLLAFPWLTDPELQEALWALGQMRSAATSESFK
jgi:hypothetical protein